MIIVYIMSEKKINKELLNDLDNELDVQAQSEVLHQNMVKMFNINHESGFNKSLVEAGPLKLGTMMIPKRIFKDGMDADDIKDRLPKATSLYMPNIKTRNKLTHEEVLEIRKLLNDGMSQSEIAAKYDVKNSTISSIKIGKTWQHIPDDDAINLYMAADIEHREMFLEINEELIKTWDNGEQIIANEKIALETAKHKLISDNANTNLFGEPIPQEPIYDAIGPLIGQDILDIKTLTGKRERAAKEALQNATVEMMKAISEDCIYIAGNVASSKNGKEIGFYFKKNVITGKNDKVNILVDSKVTQKYKKETAGSWLQAKVKFLNQTRHLSLPLRIEFTFIRDSMRRFDFINACQVVADLMATNGYFPDDDSIHFVPVFNPVVYYHQELAGVLIRVL